MNISLKISFTLTASLMLLNTMLGDVGQSLFQEGNAAYYENEYTRAIELYNEALEIYHSDALHYNLANAYAQNGDSARAILHYKRALVLNPNHPEARANLKTLQNSLQLTEPAPSALERYTHWFSVNTWTLLLCVGAWGSLVFLCILPWVNCPKRVRIGGTSLSGILLLASLLGLAGWHLERNNAILIAEETPLRTAPTSKSPTSGKLAGGTEVVILDRHGDYLQIRTATDATAWVPLANCAAILPQE